MAEVPVIKAISEFDVIQFAKDVMLEIEKIRSYDPNALGYAGGIGFGLGIPVESRVNAFFRLIGFPMFVKLELDEDSDDSGADQGERVLTPGFGVSFSSKLFDNYIVSDNKDIKISIGRGGTESVKLADALAFRESSLAKVDSSIGIDEINGRMSDALGSPIPLAPNVPEKGISPGQVKIGGTTREVFKKLKPLVTTYASGVAPTEFEVARPFMFDKKERMVDDNVELPRPFLETVIRVRSNADGGGTQSYSERQSEFFKTVKNSIGEQFDTIFAENTALFQNTTQLESFIIEKMFSTIKKLADKWVNVQLLQEKLIKQGNYKVSIDTVSSAQSAFGKRVVVTSTLKEDSEENIKRTRITRKIAEEELTRNLLVPFDDDFIASTTSTERERKSRNAMHGALSNSFIKLINFDIDQLKENLDEVNDRMKKNARRMEKVRLEVEMLTGEFLGLSVTDIVIVITALFIIDKKDLFALLDTESRESMAKEPSLETALKSAAPPETTSEIIKSVEKIGQVVDQLYDFLNNEISMVRTRSVTKRGAKRKVVENISVSYSERVGNAKGE